MDDDRRCMHSSVYCYKLWQNFNHRNVRVHVCTCQPCASYTLTNGGAIYFDAFSLKSNIWSLMSVSAAATAVLIRWTKTVLQLGPAEQTDCKKESLCGAKSHTGVRDRIEALKEKKKRFLRDTVKGRSRQKSNAQWNDGMEWGRCNSFLDSLVKTETIS